MAVTLAAGDLVLRVLPASARARACEAWRAVEEAAGEDVPPFARWSWTGFWLDHFGEAVRHEYLVAERDNLPCGIALLTRSTRSAGPLTVRRLHFGTAGEPVGEGVCVEYNGLCAPSAERADVARAFVNHVHRTSNWDELCLDGFDPEHAASVLAAERRFNVVWRASPLLQLGHGSEDLVDTLRSKSARACVRRSLRGISPYTTEWAPDAARAHAIMDDLERLHQERWRARGERGAFASARFRRFHRQVVEHWVPEGRAVVFAVRRADETIAALYGFVVDGTLQFYQGGFRMSDHNKVRVGYAAHLLLASAARERGLDGYEYLAGDHRYKTALSTTERTLIWATLSRRRPRAMVIHAARTTRRSFRRWRTINADPTSTDDDA